MPSFQTDNIKNSLCCGLMFVNSLILDDRNSMENAMLQFIRIAADGTKLTVYT